MEIVCFLLVIFAGMVAALWNDLNCPAPRSPENGLSFIFRNGELVHFRCHPGYGMQGKAVAYCVNSQWTVPAPECFPLKKARRRQGIRGNSKYNERNYYNYENPSQRNISVSENRKELNSKLFNWEKKAKLGAYGDGPRRVPIINGIWPDESVQIMSLGPQSTPGPKQLIRDEIEIAELRQKQYEEVAHHRHSNPNLDLLPAKKHKKGRRNKKQKKNPDENDPRQTIIALGKTEDGDALSVALAKPAVETNQILRDRNRRKKKKGLGKKLIKNYKYPSNIISRSSRVETSGISPFQVRKYSAYGENSVTELKGRPVQNVQREVHLAQYDTSCLQSFYGRELPMIAPQVQNAFVYRYETKKNDEFPFNSYMTVKYRCLSEHSFANVNEQTLNCRDAKWVGTLPICIKG